MEAVRNWRFATDRGLASVALLVDSIRGSGRSIGKHLSAALLLIFVLACLSFSPAASGFGTARDPNKLQTLTIQIQVGGFLQSSLTIPYGYYYVVIANRSGRRDLHLTLEKMPGVSIVGTAQAQVFAAQGRVNSPILGQTAHLDPGTYRLSVAERPSWVCRITVQ